MSDLVQADPLPSYAPHKPNINRAFRDAGIQWGDESPYAAAKVIFTRVLGDIPTFYPILTLSPPTMRTFLGTFGPLFDSPAIDMGFGDTISPHLRRVAFRWACVGFSCMYCVAHACGLGDVFSGSVPISKLKDESEVALSENRSIQEIVEDEVEQTVGLYSRTATLRPFPKEKSDFLRAQAKEIKEKLGKEALASINGIICKSGELNTMASVTGVEMEDRFFSFVNEEIPIEDTSTRNIIMRPLIWVKDVFSITSALVSLFLFSENNLYAGLPHKPAAILGWAEERIGKENAYFLNGMDRARVRRVFCFGLRETLFVERGTREWSAGQRAKFIYRFAEETGAVKVGASAEKLVEWDRTVKEGKGKGLGDQELAAAMRMVKSCAEGSNGELSEEVVKEVTAVCSPEAIVELVGILGFLECWRRMEMLYSMEI